MSSGTLFWVVDVGTFDLKSAFSAVTHRPVTTSKRNMFGMSWYVGYSWIFPDTSCRVSTYISYCTTYLSTFH